MHNVSAWLANMHSAKQSVIKSFVCAVALKYVGCVVKWRWCDFELKSSRHLWEMLHFLSPPPRLLAEAAVIFVSQFWSDVTSGWRRPRPICPIPCACYFLWSQSDVLQRRKIGTCRKNNLIKSTFPIWALTHPVTEKERKSFWRGCWISCSCFPLRNVIESPRTWLPVLSAC